MKPINLSQKVRDSVDIFIEDTLVWLVTPDLYDSLYVLIRAPQDENIFCNLYGEMTQSMGKYIKQLNKYNKKQSLIQSQ